MAWHILTVFWLKLICDFLYLLFHVTLLLTFSQLPNEYIISFIHKNTNKTQKISHFLIEINTNKTQKISHFLIEINTNKTQKISHFLGEIAISIVTSRSQSRSRRSRLRHRDRAMRRLQSRLTPIGAVPMITIAIDADRSLSLSLSVFCSCGFFLSVALSLFCACYRNRLKVKRFCKMISGSTSANFGQTEIIFRKIYFP